MSTTQNTLDDIDPRNGWTYNPETNQLTRHAETHQGSGCNLCGGTQDTDPDADDYCWHTDNDTHIEAIHIEPTDDIIVWESGWERARLETRADIIDWMETHPDAQTA